MRVFISLVTLVVLPILFSCTEETSLPYGPTLEDVCRVRFLDFFPNRNRDLSNKFSNEIYLKRGTDTLKVEFKYDKSATENHIVVDSDTVFSGKVSRYKQTYYLSRLAEDTLVFIHAFKVKGNIITGLGNETEQLLAVESFFEGDLFKGKIQQKCRAILLKKTPKYICLTTQKRLVGSLYHHVLSSMKGDTIIRLNSSIEATNLEALKSLSQRTAEANGFEIFTQPESNTVTIRVKEISNDVLCKIVNLQGKVVYNAFLIGTENVITINVKPGFYLVQLHQKGQSAVVSKIYIGN